MFSGKRVELNGDHTAYDQSSGLKPCFCRKNCPGNGVLKSVSPAQPSCGSTRVTKIVVPAPRASSQAVIEDRQLKNRTIKIQVSRNKMKKRPFKPAPARYSPRTLRTRSHAITKTIPEKPLSPTRPPPPPSGKSESDSSNTPWSEILTKQSKISSNGVLRSERENEFNQKYKSRNILLRKDRGSQTFDFDKVVEAVNSENIYVKNRGVQCCFSENSVMKPKKSTSDFTISFFEEALLQRLISRFKEELRIAKKDTPIDSLWAKSRETRTTENSKYDLLEAQKEIEYLKRQIETKSQELIESQKHETELKTAVDEAQKRVDAMSAQFADFRQVIVTNTERVRRLQAENRALRRTEQALPEAIEEVDRLRTELSLVTLDRDKARAYLSLKEEEVAQLKGRLEKEPGEFYADLYRKAPAIVEEHKHDVSTSLVTYPKGAKFRPDSKTIQISPTSDSRSTSAASIETLKATLTEVFDMIKRSAENMVKEAEHRQNIISKVHESGDYSEVGCGPPDTISIGSSLKD